MEIKEKRPMGERIKTILANTGLCVLLLVSFLGFFAAWWYVRIYGRIGFDSVLFTLTGGLGGVSPDLIRSFLLGGALPAVLCAAAVGLLLCWPWNWKRWIPVALSLALSLGLLAHAAWNVELVDYVLNSYRKTELYQQAYRDPEQVKITFPEKKAQPYLYLYGVHGDQLSFQGSGRCPGVQSDPGADRTCPEQHQFLPQ